MTASDLRTGSRFKRSPDGKVLDVVSVKEHDADKRFLVVRVRGRGTPLFLTKATEVFKP